MVFTCFAQPGRGIVYAPSLTVLVGDCNLVRQQMQVGQRLRTPRAYSRHRPYLVRNKGNWQLPAGCSSSTFQTRRSLQWASPSWLGCWHLAICAVATDESAADENAAARCRPGPRRVRQLSSLAANCAGIKNIIFLPCGRRPGGATRRTAPDMPRRRGILPET
eukprot:365425-Chlamydomonas_euryale.AAC.21